MIKLDGDLFLSHETVMELGVMASLKNCSVGDEIRLAIETHIVKFKAEKGE